jgi:NAD(P)-dependent dehydrogenase (short-subunit alcohol dehydrogenase family)
MATLNGKTALVTGASRGIGRSIAERLAADGADVGVHYGTNSTAAKDLVATITQAGGAATPIQAEFGLPDDIPTLLTGVDGWLAGRPLDILVNNAGIFSPTPIAQVTPEEFDRVHAVNVRAPFFLIQGALPRLSDGGRIVSISSASTRIAAPFAPYAMTKGAIEVLTLSLAHFLGPRGITVNAVAPGVIETDMGSPLHDNPQLEALIVSTVALGRFGRPRDVSDVVAFLVSDEARWVTGTVIDASGGQLLGFE